MKKILLFTISLFIAVTAMAQSPFALLDGHEVTFTNIQQGGVEYTLFINDENVLAVSTESAETLGNAAKFLCNVEASGKLSFYNESKGLYMIWRGKGLGYNDDKGVIAEYNATYCDWEFYTSSISDAYYFAGKRKNGTLGTLVVMKATKLFDAYGATEANHANYSNLYRIDVPGTNLAAAVELGNAILQVENYPMGDEIGQYTSTIENWAEEFAAIKEFYSSITEETSIDDIEAKITELTKFIPSFSLNMPERGKYYRFKGHGTDNYMLSDVHTDAKYLAMGSGELASAIFYYGEDGSLLSYANGRYLSDAAQNSSDWTCLAVGTVGSAATFAAGKTLGEYGFYVGDDSSRAYYSGRKTYVDAGGSIAANNGYDWIIEEVTTLPVTVTEAGYATFFAPVEVTVPAGDVTAHTVTVDGEWASLSEALTTIPANTGVVLANTGVVLANAGTVELAINYEGTAAAIEGNVLAGTAAKSIISIENGSYYVLAKPEGAEVAGLYTPKNGDDKTTFINGSHKAYMHLAAQGAAYYSFRFPGTTGIEEITENRVQSTVIYDLTGRRVEAITAPGIYIVNGKKTLVK